MARKNNKKISYSAKKKGTNWIRLLQLLPIYLTVGLLPLMVRLYVYDPNLAQFPWYYTGKQDIFGDTYLAYRQWWFTGISFYMLIVLLLKYLSNKKSLRLSVPCIPMAVFALFSFLSALCSKYRSFSFLGGFEQFENVFVLMGYALIVYYCFLILDSEKEVRSILYVLTASTLLLGLIGAGQTLGHDFIATEFASQLIVPSGIDAELSITTPQNTACMTLYNPNYVGVYVAMLFPLYVVLLLFSKKWMERFIYTITVLLLLLSLYGSGSKAAFLVIAGELLILLILLRRPLLKRWYFVIPAAAAMVAVFLLVNQAQDNAYIDRIVQALKLEKTEHELESIETKTDGVWIRYKENNITVQLNREDSGYIFGFYDENGERMNTELSEDQSAYIVTDPRFYGAKFYLFEYEGCVCFAVEMDGRTWRFTNEYDDSGSYYYLTDKGKFDQMVMAEQVLFADYETILSGRGYIWSVTLPLIRDHIVLGSGADTFAITFPQQDYLRLWRNGYSTQVMTKPHSLYLQVGVQDGVIALLGLVVFFILYLSNSVRLYLNSRFESFYEQAGIAVMLAVIGFAVMGISNDSTVAVSPVFWAIAGLGVYLNASSAELIKARKSKPE